MIALIIPCWNQLEYSKQAIASISAKSYPHNIEYIIIDNGSTDGTAEYLKSLNLKHVITNPVNLGVSKAWNQGLERAISINADQVAILNNDIVVGPKWLDPIMREFSKNENCYYLANGAYNNPHTLDADVLRDLPQLAGKRTPGRAGWALFFSMEAVKKFYPIPEEFFLWFGDDYIHNTLTSAGYSNDPIYSGITLLDCCILHYGSRSVAMFSKSPEVIEQDKARWKELCGKKTNGWFRGQ